MDNSYLQNILGDIDIPIEENEDFLALEKKRKKAKKKLKKAFKNGNKKKIKKFKKQIKKLNRRCERLQEENLALISTSQKSSFDFGRLINECAPKLLDALLENYRSRNQRCSDIQSHVPCFTTKKN